MALKVRKPIPSKISTSDEEMNDEDLDETESEDDRNLLSDDSDNHLDEESIHSSDDDQNTKDSECKFLDNPAWADAMAKILKTNKPKRKKGIVLARAKKLNDKKVTAPVEEKLGFDIVKNEQYEEVKTEGEVKQEKDIKEEKPDPLITLTAAQRRSLKKVWHLKGRVKPSALDKDREKALSKIATRGVITLFNAVRQQQKTLAEKLAEANGLEVKRDKALKSINKKEFLDTLAERAKCENIDNPIKSESESDGEMTSKQTSMQASKRGKTWDVLRNNFMMGASMKDWDKEEETPDTGKVKRKGNIVEKKSPGGAKFSFSMDVDAEYDDNEEQSLEGSDEDFSESEGDQLEGSDGNSSGSDGNSSGSDGDEMEGSDDFSD